MNTREFFDVYNSSFEKLKKCNNSDEALKVLDYCDKISFGIDIHKMSQSILYKYYLYDKIKFWKIVPKIIFERELEYANIIYFLFFMDSSTLVLSLVPEYANDKRTKRNRIYDYLYETLKAGDREIYPFEIEIKKGYKTNIIKDKDLDIFSKEPENVIHNYSYYYVKTTIFFRICSSLSLYFQTFEEFVDYLKNDLSDCDLLDANLDGIDLSNYKTNKNTKINIKYITASLKYKKIKYYEDKKYFIENYAIDKYDNIVDATKDSFDNFTDFLKAVNYDLTDCYLFECKDLEKEDIMMSYNLDKAIVKSNVLLKVGYPKEKIDKYNFSTNNLIKNELVERNEKDTSNMLSTNVRLNSRDVDRIMYISDLHLDHKIYKMRSIRTKSDIYIYLRESVSKLLNSFFSFHWGYWNENNLIIIAGDISADPYIYKLFIALLSELRQNEDIIIVPGNHDLWSYNKNNWKNGLREIKQYVEDRGLFFLHNNIVYMDNNYELNTISEEEINNLSIEEIRIKTKRARCIVFGGLGFTGYNQEINASIGLYRNSIIGENILDLEDDIVETKRFEKLYNKVEECYKNKNIIVATHTPLTDWHKSGEYHNEWIYISGHDHKNYIYDDRVKRIYADNQIGYSGKSYTLKSLSISYNYDIFADYDDGIYVIDCCQYMDFAKGKNLNIKFHDYNIDILLLKKGKYYCFISRSSNGNLCILNGGQKKSLKNKNIKYYYNNLEKEIDMLDLPMKLFFKMEQDISSYVRKIGGAGTIHGCIIDIDFFNHIYLNPYDRTTTFYYATDIVNKKVYSNLPSLLKYERPDLYNEYCIMSDDNTAIQLFGDNLSISDKTTMYYETDIYRESRQIRAMQYLLTDNILRVWYDITDEFRKKVIDNIPKIE